MRLRAAGASQGSRCRTAELRPWVQEAAVTVHSGGHSPWTEDEPWCQLGWAQDSQDQAGTETQESAPTRPRQVSSESVGTAATRVPQTRAAGLGQSEQVPVPTEVPQRAALQNPRKEFQQHNMQGAKESSGDPATQFQENIQPHEELRGMHCPDWELRRSEHRPHAPRSRL